jgi:hypothetical protein
MFEGLAREMPLAMGTLSVVSACGHHEERLCKQVVTALGLP